MATKSEVVTIRVTPEEKEKLQKMAFEKDMTVSKLLHRMIFQKEEN